MNALTGYSLNVMELLRGYRAMNGHEVVGLFCGCGGLDHGFRDQGFDLIYASDSDLAAVDCYARNLDSRVVVRDVESQEFRDDIADIGKCDVVLGGFPCQGFSKAGPKLAEDARNSLYVEMNRAVEVLQPLVFIAENVDGISQNFRGEYVKRIVRDFKEIGYYVEHRILDAISFGVPQFRRRIFFIGVSDRLDRRFSWPIPTHRAATRNGEFKVSHEPTFWDRAPSEPLNPPQRICDVLADLVELNEQRPDHQVTSAWPKKYEAVFQAIGQGQKLCNVRHSPTSVYTWQIPEVFGKVSQREQLVLETIATHRRHKKYGEIPNGNPLPVDEIERLAGLPDIDCEIHSLLTKGYLRKKHGKFDLKGAMFCSGLFKRPKWDGPSPTVLTNFHNPRYFLHPLRDRPFSLRECARLQGFPDEFVFAEGAASVSLEDGYRLVGNAVPPPVSRQLAASVAEFIDACRGGRKGKHEATARAT